MEMWLFPPKPVQYSWYARRTTRASRVKHSHELHVNERHVHLIEIKFCEDTRPQHQLSAAKQQHANLCNLISTKAKTIHPILLGVGWNYLH
eukprot:1000976-Pelagomonas_calceolata.AAC.1